MFKTSHKIILSLIFFTLFVSSWLKAEIIDSAFNKTLSGKVKMNDVNGAGLKEDISQDHTMNGTITNKIGFTLNKNTEDIGLSFNFEYSNKVNNILNFSISKKF